MSTIVLPLVGPWTICQHCGKVFIARDFSCPCGARYIFRKIVTLGQVTCALFWVWVQKDAGNGDISLNTR